MNIRVAESGPLRGVAKERSRIPHRAKGARFEIRCYMRDPDGYIIEVGQSKNG